jgi:hypothetical protein
VGTWGQCEQSSRVACCSVTEAVIKCSASLVVVRIYLADVDQAIVDSLMSTATWMSSTSTHLQVMDPS